MVPIQLRDNPGTIAAAVITAKQHVLEMKTNVMHRINLKDTRWAGGVPWRELVFYFHKHRKIQPLATLPTWPLSGFPAMSGNSDRV